jgi:tight adherence protein B
VIRIQRAFMLALAAAVLLMWMGTQHARAAVSIQGLDAKGYPTLQFSVVTSSPSSVEPRVTEDGQPAGSVAASNLGRSKTVVLAIDRSRSMAGQALQDASAAADAFVSAKPASDSIGIVAFGKHALALTSGFSTSTIDAIGALRSISVDAQSGTALYDAITLASGELASQPARGRVLIVLTDGKDVSSRATLADAVRAARQAGVAVYPIAIAGSEYTPAPLQRLAQETGGQFFKASDSGALMEVYSTIASQLARTWRISFLTTARPGDDVKLRVTVPGQGAAARDVQVPGGPGGAEASPGPSPVLPSGFYGSSGTLAVAIAVGCLVLLAFVILLAAKKSVWLKERLEPHIAPAQVQGKRRASRQRLAFASSVIRATERALGNLRQFRALSRLLERADLPLRAAEFAYLALACAIVLSLLAFAATRSGIALFLGFVVGALPPFGFVMFKARRRLKQFENQLPDLLITLAASLKAGHSFRQGIQSVVDEGQAPASDEFKRVLTDTQLGRPMEDSLVEMADRVGSKNFSFVITAVTIQRQVGGSLAGLFDMVAETVRQRQQFQRRIRSLTAMGRMSAYVLIGLPFFLAIAMTVINKSFMAPLWQRHAGHMLIAAGLTMMLVGSAILKKIVSFKG